MSSERNIHELLAPDRLSGGEREQVLADVLLGLDRAGQRAGAGAPARRPWLRRPWFWGLSGAGAAAVAAVALVLMARPPAGHHAADGDGMTVKGPATSAGQPMIELVCSRGTLARCPRGSTLVFRIDGLHGSGALTAWADPIDQFGGAPGRQRIWYFSADDHPALVDGRAGGSLVARKAIEIGPEHAEGGYRVHVLLSDRPLARREALSSAAPPVRAEAVARLEVVP